MDFLLKVNNFINNHQTLKNLVTLPSDGVKSLFYLYQSAYYEFVAQWPKIFRKDRDYYLAKMTLVDSKIEGIWNKRHFGSRLIHPVSNIAKREVLKDQEDLSLTKKLLTEIKIIKNLGSDNFLDQVIIPDEDPEYCLREGICSGINLWVADQLLNETKTLDKIGDELKEGAPAEAAAYQAISQLLCVKSKLHITSREKNLERILEQIKTSKEFNQYDLNACLHALALKLETGFPTFKQPFDAIVDAYKKESDYGQNRDLSPLLNRDEKELVASLFQYCEGVIDYYQELRNPPPKESKGLWQIALKYSQKLFGKPEKIEYDATVFKKIQNPKHRILIQKMYQANYTHDKYEIMARYLKLKFQDVHSKIGLPGQFPSDTQYLENFRHLKPGTYRIGFLTKKYGHTILYKKDENGQGFILDPNIGILECYSEQDTFDLMKEILNRYSSPNNTHPDHKQGDINHQLRLVKIEPSQSS